MKSPKKKTITYWKKKAWNQVSLYVRMVNCLETTGTLDWGKCYTCGKKLKITQLQGGHLLDGHTGMNYLDERGVKSQCYSCNVCNHGLKEVYIPKFIKEFGQELFDELARLKRIPCIWKQPEYEAFIEIYKNKIQQKENYG